MVERHGDLSDHAHRGSQLPDGVIPYSRPCRAGHAQCGQPPAATIGPSEDDEPPPSALPEPSGERAALVERMLPAYRALLRSGDQIPVQDKGHTVHG